MPYTYHDWLLFMIYMFISIVALVSNSFVIYVIYVRKRFTNTYLLIANNCLSDAFGGIINIWLWYICSSTVLKSRQGFLLCELSELVKTANMTVNGLSVTVIAIDRYLQLYRPGDQVRAKKLIPFVWCLAFIIAMYNNIDYYTTSYFTEHGIMGCRVTFDFKINFFRKRYSYIPVFFFLVVFTIVIIYCYFKVIQKVESRKVIGENGVLRKRKVETAKLKTISMLITMIAVYLTFNVPYYLAMFIGAFLPIFPAVCDDSTRMPAWWVISYVMLIGSTVFNPFIMAYFNKDLKEELVLIFSRPQIRNDVRKKSLSRQMSKNSHSNNNSTQPSSIHVSRLTSNSRV